MIDLSLATVTSAAATKVVLVVALVVAVFLYRRRASPLSFSLLAALAFFTLGALFLFPLQRMWWGNNGDEMFIGAFLTRVIAGAPWSDFYYPWLPPFYPPLYFWIVGGIARLFSWSTIFAAGVGASASLAALFGIPALIGWRMSRATSSVDDVVLRSGWFWLLSPLLFVLMLDFDTFLVKPYETLPALLVALYIGAFALALRRGSWRWRDDVAWGCAAGVLFMLYYFWWFTAAPTLLLLALLSDSPKRTFLRLCRVGLVAVVVALPFLGPLLWSFVEHGIESWQASYFVPADVATFVPWAHFDFRGLLAAVGVASFIVYREQRFIRALGILFAVGYLYQFMNIGALLFGFTPAQSAKPFLFLGTATLAVAVSYGLVSGSLVASLLPARWRQAGIALVALTAIAFSPFVKFVDDPVVLQQIEKDRTATPAQELSSIIADAVPDAATRVWVSSGAPDMNLYLPLSYAVAYNPHFSHPAVQYSQRFATLKSATDAVDAATFSARLAALNPAPTAFLLYFDQSTQSYPIFFWADAYPNGGKELRLDVDPRLIDETRWERVRQVGDWHIFLLRQNSEGVTVLSGK